MIYFPIPRLFTIKFNFYPKISHKKKLFRFYNTLFVLIKCDTTGGITSGLEFRAIYR